jgi:hypothetical protein
MLTADEARIKSLESLVVMNEVRDIEQGIIVATETGDMQTILAETTTMAKATQADSGYATAADYYNAWQGTTDDRQKVLQMNAVIQYFSDLGYTIERQLNPTSQATFQWIISW